SQKTHKWYTTGATPTLTTTPSAARRRKGVVIRDPEESANPSTIIHSEAKSKDKGKRILVEEPKPLKNKLKLNRMKPIGERKGQNRNKTGQKREAWRSPEKSKPITFKKERKMKKIQV
nr:hypothetical protein [Tanacetum cinerariifolium]